MPIREDIAISIGSVNVNLDQLEALQTTTITKIETTNSLATTGNDIATDMSTNLVGILAEVSGDTGDTTSITYLVHPSDIDSVDYMPGCQGSPKFIDESVNTGVVEHTYRTTFKYQDSVNAYMPTLIDKEQLT